MARAPTPLALRADDCGWELQFVTDALPAAAVRCARNQTFLWVNACYASWVGRSPSQIVGRSLVEVIGRDAMREIEPYIARVLEANACATSAWRNFQASASAG